MRNVNDGYDTAQVCENGHVVTSSLELLPAASSKFCEKCSAPTMRACPSCEVAIRGSRRTLYVGKYEPPAYCFNCGQAFPWTAGRLAAGRELIEASEATVADKAELVKDLDALAKDTPRTQLAAMRMKKFLTRAGSEIGPAMRQILIEIATAEAKQHLGL